MAFKRSGVRSSLAPPISFERLELPLFFVFGDRTKVRSCFVRVRHYARPNYASVKPVVTLASFAVAQRLLTTATDFGKNNS